MIELLRTNDPVLISWLTAVLGEIGVEIIVLDSHTSILGGSANAIRRRVMVIDDDFAEAKRTFEEAAAELNGDVGIYEYPK
ncbi:MAG: putative signal transducing protein [Rhodospirillales bacterium]|jgi:hypothetical protein